MGSLGEHGKSGVKHGNGLNRDKFENHSLMDGWTNPVVWLLSHPKTVVRRSSSSIIVEGISLLIDYGKI